MPENQINRPEPLLQPCRQAEQFRHFFGPISAAFSNQPPVMARHMKRPEGERRTSEIIRHLHMAVPDHLNQPRKPPRLRHFDRRQCPPVNMAHHQRAGFRVNNLGRNSCAIGRLRRRQLVPPQNQMNGIIIPDPDDITLALVTHEKVSVGQPARKRLHRNLFRPACQACRPALRRHHPVS